MIPVQIAKYLATPHTKIDAIRLKRVETYIYQATVNKPVVSSLATINKRVALLVRLEDVDGHFGWGEIYATMPSFGAPHRAQIVHQILTGLLKDQLFEEPSTCWQLLQKSTHPLQIQTGEFGPFSAAIAGIDCAFWDLYARKQKLPLAVCLGGNLRHLPVYASGLNPADGPLVVNQSRENGFLSFKQKSGFNTQIDINNLTAIAGNLRPNESLMVDVNQGWNIEKIRLMGPLLEKFPLHWIEEPLPADSSSADWLACKKILNKPLAGGENLRSDDFKTQAAWLDIVQPDVGKWGGISANWGIAKLAIEQGKTYCPHWLGSGLGLMASAHLLAAIGGNGLLEIDVNENPLREILAQTLPAVTDGLIKLSTSPGIGVVPNLELASPWLTNYQETIL